MHAKARHLFDFKPLRATGRPGRKKTTSAVLAEAASAAEEKHHSELLKKALSAQLPEIKTVAYLMLFLATTIGLLYFARPAIVPVVTAGIAGMALKPLVRLLHGLHFPLILASALVVGLLVFGVAEGFSKLGRPAMELAAKIPDDLALLKHRTRDFFRPAAKLHEAAAAVKTLGKPEEPAVQTVAIKDNHDSADLLHWTSGLMGGIVETLAVLFLLLASGDMFLLKLVRVTPSLGDKKRVIEMCGEIQQHISRYLLSVTAINLCLGAAVAAGLYFLGMPRAALWGAVVALLNYVPYFGPIAGICVLTLGGVLAFEDFTQAVLPAGWYLALHLIEANFITPTVLGRSFTLNPVVIIISLIFWTWLWGVAGALLSVPILMCFKVVCDRIPVLYPVSEFLGN